jgi:hypothetical protein
LAKSGGRATSCSSTSPHAGLEYYEYDFAERRGTLSDVCGLVDAKFKDWNNLGFTPTKLFLHYGNRLFRQWQLEHGGGESKLIDSAAAGAFTGTVGSQDDPEGLMGKGGDKQFVFRKGQVPKQSGEP